MTTPVWQQVLKGRVKATREFGDLLVVNSRLTLYTPLLAERSKSSRCEQTGVS